MDPNLQPLFKTDDISTVPAKLLWHFFLRHFFNSKLSFAYTFITLGLCFLCTTLAIKGILLSDKSDVFFISENIQTCVLMAHITGNVLNLQATKQDLLYLLKQKSKFWKVTDFDNKLLSNESLKTNNFMRKFVRYAVIISVLTAVLFDLQPFVTGSLPSVCYVPDGWFGYLTVMLWYLSMITSISVTGTATLFCTLAVSLAEQFHLLAHNFKSMCNNRSDDIWKELEVLVEHHNFLISYFGKLNTAFGNMFLLLFIISISSASVAVFILMQPGIWTNRIKCGTYFCSVIIEIGFYCVPAEIVTNTALRLDRVLYDSGWYDINTISLKKCLPLVTSRAQRPMVFSGYGLINMNLNTYVSVRF
ncbi:uncharacterized protein LOC135126538 [Zophobas morio]|uniref:uncharacterized protein LOC135126538 n=1 Tax=Zophobas morio TaxID=2755281 RepID=UPI003082AC90